ncbi:MAG TPA: gephyrin-like molybdotransferase Glp [Gemmatimonadales bacterium]|nr:gephyrin-like molybdotransferase Glp [Gemmatimonadales bacterium]
MTVIRCDDAIRAVIAAAERQPMLRVPLERALDQVLATPLIATFPLPRWTAASMDGFAVHGDDVRAASPTHPVRLSLAGATRAGEAEPPPLAQGSAWRVATGGRIPANVDTIIRQEDVTVEGEVVAVWQSRDVRRNVRPEGGDVREGDLVLPAGTVIHPGTLALCAALGHGEVMVHRRPRVAILTSGDELVGMDQVESLRLGSAMADVNTPMLTAMVCQAGGVPVPLGRVPDDVDAITAAIDAAPDVDLILTAGGVSVGAHDHIPAALVRLGAAVIFRRVRIRPGGPTMLGVLPDGRPLLALPGNPVSAFVTFTLFGRAMIRAMLATPRPLGEHEERRESHGGPVPGRSVALASPISRHPTLDQFVRVTVSDEDPPVATPTGEQASWVLTSIARADALVRIDAGVGEVVRAELLAI